MSDKNFSNFLICFKTVECKSEKYIVNGNLTLDCSSFHGENIKFSRSDNSKLINEKANILIIPNESRLFVFLFLDKLKFQQTKTKQKKSIKF